MASEITLGVEVKDRISGFRGVAVSKHTHLQGCDRFGVQPPVNKDGELPDAQVFDEPDLEVVGDGVTKALKPEPVRRQTGGPHDHEIPAQRPPDARTHT